MNSNIQTSKSILAKLLATENITVSHQKVKTAYFDLKARTMVLPVWTDMDGDLYDLLTGHEVGHALNTPESGWHHEVSGSTKKFKDFLNVIEDARIEKLIKRKFPGLSKSFARAYASLYERDFFGIKQLESTRELNLIDRINLRFKMGAHVIVEFNDEERAIVREIDNVETWDQVVDIARRVYDYVKQNEQDKIQNQQDLKDTLSEQQEQQKNSSDDADDVDSDDNADSEDYDDADDSEDSDGGEDADDSSDSSDDEDEEESDDSDEKMDGAASGESADDEDDDEPHSVTDQNFRRREQELVNDSGAVYMFNLPDANIDNLILPNTEVMNDLDCFFQKEVADKTKRYGINGISYEVVVQKAVRRFNSANKKVIMHILKEFEMRKKASEYARAQTARTGELNMNVLHKYKFSNDLFRKITVVPKGKNHGFVLFVDMSGSMSDILRNTIDQTLILVSFCKLAKIPVEVYGFSDDIYGNNKYAQMRNSQQWFCDINNDIRVANRCFHLKHLIGSSLSPIQYRKSFNMLCVVANEYPNHRMSYYDRNDGGFQGWDPSGFGLNGTPFIPTLLASREIITRFQKQHQLDVCNVVYLTDGEGGGSDINFPANQQSAEMHRERAPVVYFVDKKTKKKVKVSYAYQHQAAITQLVADVTGCKHIGFYVGTEKSIKTELKNHSYNLDFIKQQEMKNSLRNNNFFAMSALGYEKYFYVALPTTNVEDQKLDINDKMTKNKMAKVFGDTLNSKRTNRLLLTKLAEELAVA